MDVDRLTMLINPRSRFDVEARVLAIFRHILVNSPNMTTHVYGARHLIQSVGNISPRSREEATVSEYKDNLVRKTCVCLIVASISNG
jgi:hypothetical protein